ncbi:deoxyguanosinetriphosphate triphosphohydrolase [Aquipuribacter nitratireducens]|uniref:Deoxyguanosinetriphosphate triphosphohydrolase-like protein n=1 Tax=Aquipuribacter nitratireducens TaxID=650104 RepID=A0ABW0GLL5_9MICO
MSAPVREPVSTPGYDSPDRARWVDEPPKRSRRTAFARDRARLLHSSALRRLAAKTQVVGPDSDDFVRNRLTHSLEVAQVGRELGGGLGCDPDVVETACLAHDLGHPPFGHNGEALLDEVAAAAGGFEGNAQTLRVLTRLEPKVVRPDGRSVGLNLTRASLDAATKYPWRRGEGPRRSAPRKFGVYADDADVFAWLRDGAPAGRKSLEAQVMDLADDIAYSVHDVEDAVVAGRLDLAVLHDPAERAAVAGTALRWYGGGEGDALDEPAVVAALERLQHLPEWVAGPVSSRPALAALKTMTSALVGRFVGAADAATRAVHGPGPLTRYGADLVVPEGTRAEVVALKAVAAHYVMQADDRAPVYERQRELLSGLVAALVADPSHLQPAYLADLAEAADDAAALRVVVDQVAALTDTSAVAWHAALVGG